MRAPVDDGRSRSSQGDTDAEEDAAIGGFYVIDVESRDRAIELAKQVPLSPGLAVRWCESSSSDVGRDASMPRRVVRLRHTPTLLGTYVPSEAAD
jgi:hypothetical protein